MMDRLSRNQIAWRVAQDIAEGNHVNLGIGMPELVAKYTRWPGNRIS
jgi:3-oxoadipate CoA-transferase beta subunit